MIQFFINEPVGGLTDQSDRLYYGDQISFSLIRGQRGTAAIPLRIFSGDDYESAVGSPVYIHEIVDSADTVVYAGTIDSIERKWFGNDGFHIDTLNCVSFEQVFDTIRVGTMTSFIDTMTCGQVLTALFTTYATATPVTLGVIQDGPEICNPVNPYVPPSSVSTLSEIFSDLATRAGVDFVWGVQMSDQTLYFQVQSTTPAALTLTKYLFESGDWKLERSDFRDRQLVQIAFTAFSTSNEMFSGDGSSTDFALFNYVDRIVSAMVTTRTQATAQGVFGSLSPGSPANPDPGDTFTITGPTGSIEDPYTFVSTLDNTLRNQILIATDPGDTCVNMFHAIMATPAWAGIKFSLPTWQNDVCNADFPEPIGINAIIVRVKNPGSGGNGVTLSASSANFSWTSGMTGGADGTSLDAALTPGLLNTGTMGVDLTYQRGSNIIDVNAPIPVGYSLSVAYYRLGADIIAVEDSALVALRAAAEHGTGLYCQLITDTQNADARSGYLEAYSALQTFKSLPSSFQFSVDSAPWATGTLLTISITSPTGAPALLDGTWLVQEIQAAIVPGLEMQPEPFGHFRYTVTVINVAKIGDFVVFWKNLAIVTPPAAQAPSNQPTISATPSLLPPSTTGIPTLGTSTGAAGLQWVQEQLGLAIPGIITDLVVDASDDTVVTSASRPFSSGDVGLGIQIRVAPGWSPGNYEILSVTSGAATLSVSPAAVGTTGGIFGITDGLTYQFTWAPMQSQFTSNQIALLNIITPGTPAVTRKLTPFAYTDVGFSTGSPDPTNGPDYQISNDTVQLSGALGDTDCLIAEYFPAGSKHVDQVLIGGTDLVLEGSFGDFGATFSSASHAFVSADIGKALNITGGVGWTVPKSYVINSVDAFGEAQINFATPLPTTTGNGGGIWSLSA